MSEHSRRKKARDVLTRAGYKAGGHLKGDERQDRAMIEHAVSKGIAEHESHDHKGEKKTRVHFRDGGLVDGFAAGGRPDKKAGKHKGKTTVNVVVAPQGGGAQKVPVPVPVPAHPPMAAGAPPPGMPPGGAPMAGPPPGLRPGMGPMKRGGRARKMPEFEGGAGGALGRIEKAEHEAKRPGGQR